LAGIRWFELRQATDNDPWELYQEGTYISPYNDKHAFSGSMVMDGQGNIGMGYTTCSSQEKISIYYTGRYANDPLGQMTVDETLIAQSTSNNPSNRLADYVQISLDPSDDATFWHIAEYFKSGQRTDVVGVFQFAPNFVIDLGVASIDAPVNGDLSGEEPITITVFNYGESDQSDIPVCYFVDGGEVICETIPGPLAPGNELQYTFSTTADMSIVGKTYEITAYTNLVDDAYPENDTTVKTVTNLFPNDIGIAEILSPSLGGGYSEAEEVTVAIRNFGIVPQNDFDVHYQLDDILVTELVPDTIEMDSTLNFTFAQTADLMTYGTYQLTVYTSLEGDANLYNDTASVEIISSFCQPLSNCETGCGIFMLQLGTIDTITECSPAGYGDYTNVSTEIEVGSTNDMVIAAYSGNQYVKAWIDFNDNFLFETDEVVLDNFKMPPGLPGNYIVDTMPINIPIDAALGEHLMRIKTNRNSPVPDDACESTTFGETEDYTANIVLFTGVETIPLINNDLIVKTLGNNIFEISMESTEVNESLVINLHNVFGQKLVENRVENINGRYTYHLDLSYAKPGAYIVRLGSSQYGKVKKIIVQ
jgi:hypothetical protein